MAFRHARHLRPDGVTMPVVLRLILLGIATSVVAALAQLFLRSY
jgi:hypothetical protein